MTWHPQYAPPFLILEVLKLKLQEREIAPGTAPPQLQNDSTVNYLKKDVNFSLGWPVCCGLSCTVAAFAHLCSSQLPTKLPLCKAECSAPAVQIRIYDFTSRCCLSCKVVHHSVLLKAVCPVSPTLCCSISLKGCSLCGMMHGCVCKNVYCSIFCEASASEHSTEYLMNTRLSPALALIAPELSGFQCKLSFSDVGACKNGTLVRELFLQSVLSERDVTLIWSPQTQSSVGIAVNIAVNTAVNTVRDAFCSFLLLIWVY